MNFSSAYNESALPPKDPSVSSYMICLISRPTSTIFLLFITINVCLHLPLSVLILCHGLQQWKKGSPSSAAPVSHSNCFSYHLASMELIGVIGYILTSCGIYKEDTGPILHTGTLLYSFTWFGEMSFHMLTCLERYLAVVHPIMYLNLRNGRWIRIRNIITGFVWLLCPLCIVLMIFGLFLYINLSFVILSVLVVSFCNFSVLSVLIRPGPGEQGGGKERLDYSKQRAFYTITVILSSLLLRFVWGIIWTVVYISKGSTDCFTMTIDVWFNLPSSLILPLLFLHKTGRCLSCKKNICVRNVFIPK